jgi:hypothetical protein
MYILTKIEIITAVLVMVSLCLVTRPCGLGYSEDGGSKPTCKRKGIITHDAVQKEANHVRSDTFLLQ